MVFVFSEVQKQGGPKNDPSPSLLDLRSLERFMQCTHNRMYEYILNIIPSLLQRLLHLKVCGFCVFGGPQRQGVQKMGPLGVWALKSS